MKRARIFQASAPRCAEGVQALAGRDTGGSDMEILS
jgi:hypothetical protein